MGPSHLKWMWIALVGLSLACGGCGSSGESGSNGVPQTIDEEADVQQLFDAVGHELAELLAQGVEGQQPKAYPDCPGGGTLAVTATTATFSACTIAGITIDGSTSTFSYSVDGPVTTVALSGVFMITGLLTGTVIVQGATLVWTGQRTCWSAMGTVAGNPFGVQSADQSCSEAANCGDGTVSGAEQCDDGNIVGGDGCDSMCLVELATCDPSAPECLVGDEFDGGTLDGWVIDYINADDWSYEITGGELVVTGVSSTLACNRYGEMWSFVRLTRMFDAVDDYRLVLSTSWDPGADTAIEKVQVSALGSNMHCQVTDQTHTHNFNVPACSMGTAFGQLEAIAGAGMGTFVIERCNGTVSTSFNGTPIAMGDGLPATGVQLWFGYYKVDDLGTDPMQQCNPSGPFSTFGEIRVDRVSFETGCP